MQRPFMGEYITRSAMETEELGISLAQGLCGVPAIALYGGLGAGKTTLVRGIARGLECLEPASSPTYTLVNEYPGPRRVCHFDMYRLSGEGDLFEIGWEDYLASGALCIVEWAERLGGALPKGSLKISIEQIDGESRRVAVFL